MVHYVDSHNWYLAALPRKHVEGAQSISRTCTASVLVTPVKLPLPGVKCALGSYTSTTTVAASAAKQSGLPQFFEFP